MKNDPTEELYFEVFGDGPVPEGWVPDLAERRETLRRANVALERARLLLEHVKQLEQSRGAEPGK